jgi:hypothetical protein
MDSEKLAYKVPIVSTKGISTNRKKVAEYYNKHIEGKVVVNKDINIPIQFTKIGQSKIAYGEAIYRKKVAILQCLPEIIRNAKYNNYGNRKPQDAKKIIGYLNFKAKVLIDGKVENIRIAVRFQSNGKFYYNHEVNIIK